MTALLDLGNITDNQSHVDILSRALHHFICPVLLNKLKIPHLIGMILAGILIGEHGFDILARDSSFECSDRWDSTTSCS